MAIRAASGSLLPSFGIVKYHRREMILRLSTEYPAIFPHQDFYCDIDESEILMYWSGIVEKSV